ncbi:MAG: Wzz/FepE/Etk N-terminal domain-containing protein, partial [Cryobacterium sp.]
MELRDYIRILRKSWVLIVLFVLVGVGASAAFSLTQTPKYSATAKVFVSTQGAGTTTELQQGSSFTIQRVKTYSSLVSTPIVLLPVIATLELGITSDQLAARVSASAPVDTSIIDITVTDTD